MDLSPIDDLEGKAGEDRDSPQTVVSVSMKYRVRALVIGVNIFLLIVGLYLLKPTASGIVPITVPNATPAEDMQCAALSAYVTHPHAQNIRKRKFIAVVVTTPKQAENYTRYRGFLEAWNNSWPGLSFYRQFGLLNDPAVLGYGLLTAMALSMRKVRFCDVQFDYLLIFEDDARAFPDVTWPGSAEATNDFDTILDDFERVNGTGLLLGGHDIRGAEVSKEELTKAHGKLQVVRARGAYGSYSMVIPRRDLEYLSNAFEGDLRMKKGISKAPDDVN